MSFCDLSFIDTKQAAQIHLLYYTLSPCAASFFKKKIKKICCYMLLLMLFIYFKSDNYYYYSCQGSCVFTHAHLLVSWLVVCLIDWLAGGWLADWLAGCLLACWLVGWRVYQQDFTKNYWTVPWNLDGGWISAPKRLNINGVDLENGLGF